MGRLDDIGFEYRFSVGMGAVAFVLSLLAGLVAGNSMGGILVRSAVFTLLFLAVGYVAVFVVRKYVPEFYEFISSLRPSSAAGVPADADMPKVGVETERDVMSPGPDVTQDRDVPDADISQPLRGEEAPGGKAGGFVPYKQSDFTTMSSVRLGEGKLGKHLIEEKIVKYEPKIIAEAIRTMMGRDKE